MKKYTLILTTGIVLSSSTAYALEFSASAETPMATTEKIAYENAIQLAKDISTGHSESAMEEASIECPNDNNPSFVVNRIKANQYWLKSSSQQNDKRYSGEIHYTIKCTFTHGKQR